MVEIPIQVNGKLRAKAKLRRDASEADARAAVAGAAEAQPFLAGKTEKKFLFVPGKIINVVVG